MKRVLFLIASTTSYQVYGMDPLGGGHWTTPGSKTHVVNRSILPDANTIKAQLSNAGYADIAKTDLANQLANKSANPHMVLAIIKGSVPDENLQFKIARVIAPGQVMEFEKMEQTNKNYATLLDRFGTK